MTRKEGNEYAYYRRSCLHSVQGKDNGEAMNSESGVLGSNPMPLSSFVTWDMYEMGKIIK